MLPFELMEPKIVAVVDDSYWLEMVVAIGPPAFVVNDLIPPVDDPILLAAKI